MIKKINKKISSLYRKIIKLPYIYYNLRWFDVIHNRSQKKIKKLKNAHKGETIFIVASGPSLNDLDLNLLTDKNIISIHHSRSAVKNIKLKSHYWLLCDNKRINELLNLDRRKIDETLLAPGKLYWNYDRKSLYRSDLLIKPKIDYKYLFPNSKIENTGFEFDVSKSIARAGTKSIFIAIQIAAYLGASKIILLGADFGFTDNKHHFSDEINNYALYDIDPYKRQYDKKIKPALEKYKNILKERGINIHNASTHTRDDVLNKTSFIDHVK